jgi:hypothetical protein
MFYAIDSENKIFNAVFAKKTGQATTILQFIFVAQLL